MATEMVYWIDRWSRNPNQLGKGYQRNFHLNYLMASKSTEIPKSSFKGKSIATRKPKAPAESENIKANCASRATDQLRRFPPEIRTIIFRFVLEPQPEAPTLIVTMEKAAYYYPTKLGVRATRCGARNVRLLETSKWIHAEAAALLYRETKFLFEETVHYMAFFRTLSQKYLDVIKYVQIMPKYKHGWGFFPTLRNLKTLSFPIYSKVYSQAKDAKGDGFLMEEIDSIRSILLFRGLTNIIIEDPQDILKNYPELAATKTKLDALIINTVKRPRKIHGGNACASMDNFSPAKQSGGRDKYPGHWL